VSFSSRPVRVWAYGGPARVNGLKTKHGPQCTNGPVIAAGGGIIPSMVAKSSKWVRLTGQHPGSAPLVPTSKARDV
jgi:hypothetical protein